MVFRFERRAEGTTSSREVRIEGDDFIRVDGVDYSASDIRIELEYDHDEPDTKIHVDASLLELPKSFLLRDFEHVSPVVVSFRGKLFNFRLTDVESYRVNNSYYQSDMYGLYND